MNPSKVSLGLSSLALVIAAAAGGPVIAAKIVPNSDKVDGLDAVKSTATVKKRKGKLVATDKKGRLPNDIIKVAPDAARLGGFTAAQSRSVPLLAHAADLGGGAEFTGAGGIQFTDTGFPRATWTFVIPRDYRAGSPLSAEVYVAKTEVGACGVVLSSESLAGSESTTSAVMNVVNGSAGEAAISFPVSAPGDLAARKVRITVPPGSLVPGGFLAVQMERQPSAPADNCGSQVLVIAGEVRY